MPFAFSSSIYEFNVDRPQPTDPSRAHARLTAERKRIFLEHLARTGVVAESARVASPQSSARHGALTTFKDERGRDPEFAKAWDEAVDHAVGVLEAEAFRRAVEGWDEPTRFGPVRKHSDRLLELMLKARNPQYREQRRYEVDAKTEVTKKKPLDLRHLSDRKLQLLKELLDESPCPDLPPGETQDATPTTIEPWDDRAPGSLTEDPMKHPHFHRDAGSPASRAS